MLASTPSTATSRSIFSEGCAGRRHAVASVVGVGTRPSVVGRSARAGAPPATASVLHGAAETVEKPEAAAAPSSRSRTWAVRHSGTQAMRQ